MGLFTKVLELLKDAGASEIIVFGGGIIPEEDRQKLITMGVGEIFTPGAPTQEIVDWLKNSLKASI